MKNFILSITEPKMSWLEWVSAIALASVWYYNRWFGLIPVLSIMGTMMAIMGINGFLNAWADEQKERV